MVEVTFTAAPTYLARFSDEKRRLVVDVIDADVRGVPDTFTRETGIVKSVLVQAFGASNAKTTRLLIALGAPGQASISIVDKRLVIRIEPESGEQPAPIVLLDGKPVEIPPPSAPAPANDGAPAPPTPAPGTTPAAPPRQACARHGAAPRRRQGPPPPGHPRRRQVRADDQPGGDEGRIRAARQLGLGDGPRLRLRLVRAGASGHWPIPAGDLWGSPGSGLAPDARRARVRREREERQHLLRRETPGRRARTSRA